MLTGGRGDRDDAILPPVGGQVYCRVRRRFSEHLDQLISRSEGVDSPDPGSKPSTDQPSDLPKSREQYTNHPLVLCLS
ncbi:hypothetical protein KOW79_022124 [Hemibagrus wyckioides]|uniref:Uncharacterized protein n=1 Tax=Hemibagrus wyckioides TaxID=337641 RepID=A0A9D3N2J0_9TELE|nr:hypothetical protein KOW79_022124 [Hemibagrus wyckioides]